MYCQHRESLVFASLLIPFPLLGKGLQSKPQSKRQEEKCVDAYELDVFINVCFSSFQFSSVTQSCPTLCDPMNCSTPGLPVHHQHPASLKLRSIESVMPSSHLILCHPFLLLPLIPPSIRVFSNESTLHMRWPKYWSFSFSISPSNEHPGHLMVNKSG